MKVASLVYILPVVLTSVGCVEDNYSERARLNEAKEALLRIAASQERFYVKNRTYSSDLRSLGQPDVTDSRLIIGEYTIDVSASVNTFIVTATSKAPEFAANNCEWLAINEHGERTSGPNPDCWTR